MALNQNIVSIKPREVAGSTTSSRFDFQKDWSFCELMKKHKESDDYLLLFDYHNDLVFLNSSENPESISFYQIKGKQNGNWSLTKLLKKDVNSQSIVGKLYDCKNKFCQDTESLNFVSNASCNIILRDGTNATSRTNFSFSELKDEDKNKINKQLEVDYELVNEQSFCDCTFFNVTNLSLNDSSTHSKGRLEELLYEIKPETKYQLSAVYFQLFNEIKKRSSFNGDISTFDELKEKKGIWFELFESWLTQLGGYKNFDTIWQSIEMILSNEEMLFSDIRIVKRNCTQYLIDKRDPNNDILRNISTEITASYNKLDTNSQLINLSLISMLNLVLQEYKINPVRQVLYDDNFLKAIILVECYE